MRSPSEVLLGSIFRCGCPYIVMMNSLLPPPPPPGGGSQSRSFDNGRISLTPDKLCMSLSYKLVDSPVGLLKLVAGSEKALVAVLWENDDPSAYLASAMSLKNHFIVCLFKPKRN